MSLGVGAFLFKNTEVPETVKNGTDSLPCSEQWPKCVWPTEGGLCIAGDRLWICSSHLKLTDLAGCYSGVISIYNHLKAPTGVLELF